MARNTDPVVVIGLGRFGSALALELTRRETDVLAIDSRPQVVQRLSGRLSQVVAADATDPDVLRDLGVAEFTRGVVAIGDDQQASILATATLADLGLEDVWAKGLDAQHARILRKVGAHHVVQPDAEMGERVAHLVSGRLLDWVELDEDWVFAKARPPKFLVGTPLGRSGLRSRYRVTVVSVRHAKSRSYTHAGVDTHLGYGDEIIVAGRPVDVERFVEAL